MAIVAAGALKAADNAPVIPRGAGDSCVAPTELMRRNHMDYLDHQRDAAVIDGDRSDVYSLVGCVNCHAQKDQTGKAIRIDAQGQFCYSCHAFAAVKIDCFSCHSALPESAFKDEAAGWHNAASIADLAFNAAAHRVLVNGVDRTP